MLLVVLPLLDIFLVTLDGWSIAMRGGLVYDCCSDVMREGFQLICGKLINFGVVVARNLNRKMDTREYEMR